MAVAEAPTDNKHETTLRLDVADATKVAGNAAKSDTDASSAKPANKQLADVDLEEGPGKEEVEIYCSACHSLQIVVQQKGLTRARWDELLDWMVEEQAMEEMEPGERKLVLDYLSTKLGPEN